MKKEIIILLSLFLIGFVAATNTISLTSYPSQDVWITAKDSDGTQANTLKIPEKYFLDECGGATIPYEISENNFYLTIKIKDKQTTSFMDTFGPFLQGNPIEITALPEGTSLTLKEICSTLPKEEEQEERIQEIIIDLNDSNKTEELPQEEKNITEDTGLKKILLNGYSVVEENKPMVNTIYYSVLGMTALLLIFLTIKQNTKNLPTNKKPIIPEKKEEEKKDDEDEIENEIKQTKKKLDELQEKKSKKIDEVKQKLIADQKELLRLRGHPIKDSDGKFKN